MNKTLALNTIALLLLAGCSHDAPPPETASKTSEAIKLKSTDAPVVAAPVVPSAKCYLEITLKIEPANRAAAAAVYSKYKQPFLDTIPGALSKQLLVRDEDDVVLHGFDTTEHASAYLTSSLFTGDVVGGLKPLLAASPDVKIYAAP